jgi:hypothetical protein
MVLKSSKGLSLILLSALFIGLCVIVPNVSAAPNPRPIQIPIAGGANISPGTPISVYSFGPNLELIIATQDANFTGSFVGKVEVHQSILENLKTGETIIAGLGTFTGNFDGRTGTFSFIITGQGVNPLYTNWVITGGTKGLSTLRGSGTLVITYNPDGTISGVYSGCVYFT